MSIRRARIARALLILTLCGIASATFGLKSFTVHASAILRTRPYAIDDYFAREEFVSLSVDPAGRMLAVEHKRSAEPGENYVADGSADLFSKRSDIWILDSRTGAVIWRTDGKAARETSFAPVWSPNGSELAFLQSGPNGRTALAIWNTTTRSMETVYGVDIDLTVLFSRSVSTAQDQTSHFAWSDDARLYFAGRGSLQTQPLGTVMIEEASKRWNETWNGQVSARVWDTQKAVLCDVGVRLFELSMDRKRVTKLSEGAIVAVSFPGIARRIAVVEARETLLEPTPDAFRFTGNLRVGNKSDLTHWDVKVIDRTIEPAVTRTVATGHGSVASAVLPRWSSDASRLAVITGNVLQGRERPGATLMDLVKGKSSRVTTASLSDAEALAALYAAAARDRLTEDVWASPTSSDVQEIDARVFSLHRGRAAVADQNGVKIVDRRSGTLMFSDSGVVGVVKRGTGSRVYVETHEGITWVDVSTSQVRSTSVVKPPEDSRFVGAIEAGDMFFVGDTDHGTFIWRLTENGEKVVLARANEHMASILIPKYKRIKYVASGKSREGILFLPTVSSFGDRPPVVVTAYPIARPISEYLSQFSRVSGGVAWRWHTLLGAGFAVYLVDFRRPTPVDLSSASYVETPELVMAEVIPAIEALKHESSVDATKLGFAGYSYGGYTALTLLGRTNAFDAISAEVPLANLTLNLSVIPEVRFQDCAPAYGINGITEVEAPNGFLRVGGPLYLQWERMIRASPLFHLQSATTPTLLFSGEFDLFGPSSEQVYMMLLRKGVPAQLVTYWGENHNISSPGNVRDMIGRQISWFTSHFRHQRDTRVPAAQHDKSIALQKAEN